MTKFFHVQIKSRSLNCSFNRTLKLVRDKFWESCLLFCIVPQVFLFPELVIWCSKNYSTSVRSIVTTKISNILISLTAELVLKILGLQYSNLMNENTIELNEETLIQTFSSLAPQVQLTFVQIVLHFQTYIQSLIHPLKYEWFFKPVHLILSMISQILGFNHEYFVGFLWYFSLLVKFNYPKFIS